MDSLLSKAVHGVILLNPFYVGGTHSDEAAKLIIEVTGAQWAKEHLECILPRVDDIKDYAVQRGLQFTVKPNGTFTTSMALVFMDFFAAKSGAQKEWREVNRFFNENYRSILDSVDYPTGYIVYLGWPEDLNDNH